MPNTLRPQEPDLLSCEVCLTQIPADTALNAECDEYVLHFCGIECYRQWRQQSESSEEAAD